MYPKIHQKLQSLLSNVSSPTADKGANILSRFRFGFAIAHQKVLIRRRVTERLHQVPQVFPFDCYQSFNLSAEDVGQARNNAMEFVQERKLRRK